MKRSEAHFFIFLSSFLLIFLVANTQTAFAAITVLNQDSPNEGFNDTTPVAPIAGNDGTTLGEQRLNSFQAAVDYWSDYLGTSVTLVVEARMNPMSCSPNSAILGSAGPNTVLRDFPNAPRSSTWYPVGLANELAGTDLNGSDSEISATFNSSIDNNDNCLQGKDWWYGIEPSSSNTGVSFYETVLHEIAHGLGFLTLVGEDGVLFANRPDHYMLHLMDNATAKPWITMNANQRASSSINGKLVWTGNNVTQSGSVLSSGRTAEGFAHMYAPTPYEEGSSVSHWNVDLTPSELMEPFATSNSIRSLTEKLFCDIGWPVSGCNSTPTDVRDPPDDQDAQPKRPFISRWLDILLLPATK